jgi:carbonic anhydrase/acetyltransferase-like protein (isoleucine patch superfamily)
MNKTLKQLKENFNPTARNTLSTEIISLGVNDIPVFNGQIFTGADNIIIAGNVTLENGAVIQRGTSIIAKPERKITIGHAASIMDYVCIHATSNDITIGNHVTIAHASNLVSDDAPITFANGSFGNINMQVTGGTIEQNGYLGPGVSFGKNDIVPAGEIYFGAPLFKLGFRTENGEITIGTHHIKRRNIKNVAQQLYNASEEPLSLEEYPGYEQWSRALDQLVESEKSRQLGLPFEEWLRTYSLKQLSKAALYTAEQAITEGPVVWNSTSMQIDILYLAKAKDVLAANDSNKDLVTSTDYLMKAHGYLIGAYMPKKEEEQALAQAYNGFDSVLEELSRLLSKEENVTIDSFNKENAISAACGKPLAGARKEKYTLNQKDLDKIARQIDTISQRIKYIKRFFDRTLQVSPLATLRLTEFRKMKALINTLNIKHVNITQIPDGVTVKSYDGAIPIIADDVTLIGRVDLVGNIRVDAGAVIQDSTIRTEQRVIPIIVGKNSLVRHTIIHTASREQTPVEIGAHVFINGKPGDMVVLHGSYIGPGSYVGSRAVVADEVLVSGVILPNTVLSGVEKPREWHIYGGNVCEQPLLLEKKIILRDDYKILPEVLTNPALLKNSSQSQSIINTLREQTVAELGEILDKKTRKYGDIYKHSVHLQIDLLSLETASRILSQCKAVDQEVLHGLKDLQEGYQYLLGIQEAISTSAASLYFDRRLTEHVLTTAANLLKNVKDGVHLSIWKGGEKTVVTSHKEIGSVLESTIHPSLRIDIKKDERERAINQWLNETWFIPRAEIIQRLVPNLERIANRVESLLAYYQ